MGGHKAGEIASHVVEEHVLTCFKANPPFLDDEEVTNWLMDTVLEAHQIVKRMANMQEDTKMCIRDSHGRVEFDYFCCINLPQTDGTMKRIYLDVEIQNVENPGYAPLTRGNDYLSRMITSQNGKEYDCRNYDGMKKAYVISVSYTHLTYYRCCNIYVSRIRCC